MGPTAAALDHDGILQTERLVATHLAQGGMTVLTYQRGDFDRAADHWETLLNHLPEDSEAALMARNALAEAFSLADIATPVE